MTMTHAASATSLKRALVLALGLFGFAAQPAMADWKTPWKDDDRAIVIDAYEFNPIDWEKMASDKRIAAFINKGSDGMPPEYRCGSKQDDAWKLCKNRWWKYSVTKELFMTRKQIAKSKGMLWGAYHLGRPGNPRAQADHFINFAEPDEDDLIALDIEDIGPEWMSLEDAEIFSDQIKIRTGRYPVLYTNGNTAKHISDNRADYPLLSRLPLWYARYTGDITGKFPEETWPSYALWQFSSMHNCNARSCPYRVDGTKYDIDVNVSNLDVAGLKAAWPFDELHPLPDPLSDPSMLMAGIDAETRSAVSKLELDADRTDETESGMLAAYGPMGDRPKRIDPLKLLNTVAAEGPGRDPSPVAVRPAAAADAEDTSDAADGSDAAGAVAATVEGEAAPGMPIPSFNPMRAHRTAGKPPATVTQTVTQDETPRREADDQASTVIPEPAATDSEAVAGDEAANLSSADETGAGRYATLSAADLRVADAFSLTN
ncbi:glycoside hydrolase family 25 protein [Fulvimarina sp. 2208YS6-2-32]|uniref:Glycoside hydrolase family 25 protein n=1 Tax=Fulvimarina uroteuthidis TaxID=3098149 RepID=A0ABU5I2Q5_9HYPH|nr:glycoside hydrolase family 25 protein [Fulvimarina sp. 2208YS6-2-32]MDY8109651.1 glycoside hydrolase family 25 protein [Fulvimarina sp. 2208YS6-2-32]